MKAGNKISEKIIQPKFFGDFRCIGGSCTVTCCACWENITWTESEVRRLRSALSLAEKTPETEAIAKKAEEAFTDLNNGYCRINYTDLKCPMLTGEGLCSVQKELGEEYLSAVCRKYPRRVMEMNESLLRTCDCTCPAVLDIILGREDAMELVEKTGRDRAVISKKNADEMQLAAHPEIRHYEALFRFFYDIIADDSRSLEASLVLGALAAQKLSQLAEKGQSERIPAIIEALKPQLCDPEQIMKLEAVNTNYNIKLGLGSKILFALSKVNYIEPLYDDTKTLNIDLYNLGNRTLGEFYADRTYAMRNLALNLFTELGMPFAVFDKSIYENYVFFAAAFAVFRLIGAASFSVTGSGISEREKNFKDNVCFADRGVSHNLNKMDRILELMRGFGCTSPAHLTYLLK